MKKNNFIFLYWDEPIYKKQSNNKKSNENGKTKGSTNRKKGSDKT